MAETANGALLLTMPDWSFYNDNFDWQARLNADLDAIAAAKPKALIVDVRANEGGDEVGDLILARLIDKDRGLARSRRLTRYREIPADLNPYLDTWDDSFRNWGADAKGPDANGFYDMTRWDDGSNLLKPKGPRIDAPLYVLTSPTNSSATFQFAAAARSLGLATLVGGPTGGNQRGINGGAFFFVRLPNSGLEADLPLIGYYPEGEWPDAGLTPDVAVEAQASDIISGRDPVLERTLALISG
jgi:C-terminal processing protease CtpA/Prc